MDVLKANRNERGIQNWKKLGSQTGKLKSFGIGLTVLRKLAKQIGRDHALALDLWKSDVYDAKIIALLIDDPKQITRKQAEAQVERLQGGSSRPRVLLLRRIAGQDALRRRACRRLDTQHGRRAPPLRLWASV